MLLLPASGAPGQGLSYGAVPCAGAAAGWAVKRETLALCLHLLETASLRERCAVLLRAQLKSHIGARVLRMVLQPTRHTPHTECWHFSRGTVLKRKAGTRVWGDCFSVDKVLVVQAGGLEFHPLSLRLQTKQSKTSKPKADMVACICKPRAGEVEASRPPELTTSLVTWPACMSKGRFSLGGHGGQGTGPLGNRNWVIFSRYGWSGMCVGRMGESLRLREVVRPASA